MIVRWFIIYTCIAIIHAETAVFLGDSITAGRGVELEKAYPALVGAELAQDSTTAMWKIVNAGVSGDTSAGGLRRIAWVLKAKPQLVIIALGGNDGLRGLPVAELEKNLRAMISEIRKSGSRVALIGMRVPANLGPAYQDAFAAVYPRLAKEIDVPLLPFLLDGVALDPALNQADQIHPNAEGHRRIATKVTLWLKPLLPTPTAPHQTTTANKPAVTTP